MTAVPTPNSRLDAALDYAARGWRVIPVHDVSAGACSCQKGASCGSAGKHPRISRWQIEGTTDTNKIHGWWRRFPHANVGLLMGGDARWVALDIDPQGGGYDSLAALAELPPTLTSKTGSGGEHRIFRVPDEWDINAINNTAGVIGAGLDIRSDGGQIVAAPSVSSFGRYEWVDIGAGVAPLPYWLFRLVSGDPEPEQAPRPPVQISTSSVVDRARNYIAKIEGAISGSKGHPQTFKVAIALVRGFNLSTETALTLLREYNERCKPKWSEKDLRHKINDASAKSRAAWGYLLTERPRAVVEDTSRAYAKAQTRTASVQADESEEPEESSEIPAAEPDDGQPEIVVTLDLPEMVEQACAAIAKLEVYQRARRLVSVARGQYGLETHAIGRGYLVELLTKAARWIKIAPLKDADLNLPERFKVVVDGVECKRVSVPPPASVVQAIFDRTEWPHVREIDALSEAPFLRPDGTVCQTPGYDDATRTLYQPTIDFEAIPDEPTYDDVIAARDRLLDVIVDFAWVNDVDRATWLAGLLTLFARPAIDGPTPVFVVTGNAPGAGKSLACKAAVLIATGRDPAQAAYQRREDEQIKTIASQLLASRPAVILDNVDCQFGSPIFNLLWTSTTFEARLLSTNEAPTMAARTVWWANANNITYYRDTPRRIAQMRMETGEAPEERENFKHGSLVPWVKRHRPELVACALTILRGHAHVTPRKLKAWGSYESWSKIVRSAVVWCGMRDPIESRVDVEDPELEEVRNLHAGWAELPGATGDGITIQGALDELRDRPASFGWLRAHLADAFDGKPYTARQLASLLKRRKNRMVGGRKLVASGKGNQGTRWAVVQKVTQEPDPGAESPLSHSLSHQ